MRQAWAALRFGQRRAEYSVDLRYQVINAPTVTTAISLPELTLATDSGVEIVVPAWQFTIGPLSRDVSRIKAGDNSQTPNSGLAGAEKPQMLPDRSAVEVLGTNHKRKFRARLSVLLVLLSATLLLWLVWCLLRQYRDRRVLPFARAALAIRKLPQRQSDDASWRVLHVAFNETAGKTIGAGTVENLLQRAPWLNALGDEIDEFYLASAERFFQQSDSARVVNIASLAHSLYLLEKRQAPSTLLTSTQSAAAASAGAVQSSGVPPKPMSD